MRVSRCLWCDFYFFKQKTAYEMRISDWSSDVCSSDLIRARTHVLVFGGGKIQHAVDADFRLSAKGRIEVNFVAAELQGIGQPLQRVHRHTWAVGAAFAGRAIAGGRCGNKGAIGSSLAHLVQQALRSEEHTSDLP